MDWIFRNLPTVEGRLLAATAFIVAIIVGLWPDHPREVDPVKVAAVATTGFGWLFAELADAGVPSEHDRALYKHISEVMNDEALTFLQQHDFHVDLHTRFTEPVNQIAGWHGSRYSFLDKRLQKQWQRVRDQIDKLSDLYGSNLVVTNAAGMLTTRLLGFARHEQPKHVDDEIAKLNKTATSLYHDYDAFDRYARRRLRL